MCYDHAFQFIEQLAYHAADYRCHEYVLDGRTFHKGFDSELPADGGDYGRIKHGSVEIETCVACSHEVGGTGVGMEDVIEYGIVMVPFRSFLEYVAIPACEWGDTLYFHLYENTIGPMPLAGVDKDSIAAIRRLADGTEVRLSDSWTHSDYPDVAFADLGPDPVLPDSTDTVLEVRLKGRPEAG